jgi:hypothetical protein
MAMVPWTWRHTGGRMEIMPDRSMVIKRVNEETISYHALFTFDVIALILFLLVFRYTTVA